jgi:hypothetical protein
MVLKESETPTSIWMNVYFVSMFLKLDFHVEFYGSGKKESVFVKNGEEIIGIIMPTNVIE